MPEIKLEYDVDVDSNFTVSAVNVLPVCTVSAAEGAMITLLTVVFAEITAFPLFIYKDSAAVAAPFGSDGIQTLSKV